MKTFFKIVLIVTTLIPSLTYSAIREKNDSIKVVECLKVVGVALDEKSFAIDGVEIRLFKQNDMTEQIHLTNVEDHNFKFTLEANQYYTVKVSKLGFVERWIVFYTEVPKGMNIESPYSFEFQVVLFKEKQMDDYYLDFPIAVIRFNKKTNTFETSTKYTKYIKSKIKEAEEAAKVKNEMSKNTNRKNQSS